MGSKEHTSGLAPKAPILWLRIAMGCVSLWQLSCRQETAAPSSSPPAGFTITAEGEPTATYSTDLTLTLGDVVRLGTGSSASARLLQVDMAAGKAEIELWESRSGYHGSGWVKQGDPVAFAPGVLGPTEVVVTKVSPHEAQLRRRR